VKPLESALALFLAFLAAACGSDASPAPSPAAAVSGGQPGMGGAAHQAGSTGAGQAGSSSAGGGQPSQPVGGAGAGGAAGGTGGALGGAGGGIGGGGAEPAYTCPAGPFPEPEAGEVEQLCQDFDFDFNYLEGPTYVKSQNALYFSNFDILQGTGGDIIKVTLDDKQCVRFTSNVGCNGLAVGVPGKVLGACQQSRAVESFDLVTKAPTTLASEYLGKMLDTPNDLIVHSNGTIYFTNRLAELDGRPQGHGPAVFYIDPQGTLKEIGKGDGNGIALSPDQRTLYVNNLGTWPLDENGVPGEKAPQMVGGDGLAVDCAGNLYESGGNIKNAEGQGIGSFPGGTNMAFGGPDGKVLFVVSGGSNVRAVHMNVPGIP
jgi:gluconolactonase